MPIKYLEGDVTSPIGLGNKMIIHICNNIGKWGKGFVLSLTKKWKQPQKAYLELDEYCLGFVQFIKINDKLTICNMIAQNGIKTKYSRKKRFVDYEALKKCLKKVNKLCEKNNFTIHMPRIGVGLGGGEWRVIENIINNELPKISVYVYDLKKKIIY